MSHSIICMGDKTSHGGEVLEGDALMIIEGRRAARVGDRVSCPLCSGTQYIAEGRELLKVNGRSIALENMKTSCGATLLSSQLLAKSE